MGIKDFVTGTRLYSSKGAAGRGWAVKKADGERTSLSTLLESWCGWRAQSLREM